MKYLRTIFATLGLMLAFILPPAGAHANDEHPTDTVCLTYPAVVVGCATGTIGNLAPTGCDANGCTVTLTGDLTVTPVACGWLEQGDLSACTLNPTDIPEPKHSDDPQRFLPGKHRMESDLCISDPTVTVTVPCTRLIHYFVVPSTSANANVNTATQIVNDVISLLPGVPEPDGKLVYASGTFRVYQMSEY